MPRKNRRDKRMDPREKRFLAGEPPELIGKLPRRDRWKRTRDDVPLWIEDEDEPTTDTE